MIQLALWQVCFLIQNIYFDPSAAYPLYYFLNSGYTVFSYFSLAMFSYFFITPVFNKESRIVLIAGLILSTAVLIYSIVVIFPSGVNIIFNPVMHKYEAESAPHRIVILYILMFFIILTAKNLIYKIITLKDEQRSFVLHLAIPLITGISMVVGVSIAQHYIEIDQNMMNVISTYIAGILFIYFYLTYISFSGTLFLYSDKAMLLILFVILIISSMSTYYTFTHYERAYFNNIKDTLSRAADNIMFYGDDSRKLRERIETVYGGKFEYLVLQDPFSGERTDLLNESEKFTGVNFEQIMESNNTQNPAIHIENEKIYYCFKAETGADIIYAGINYIQYREYVHRFVRTAFTTVLTIIAVLFLLMRFIVFIGLTKPLKQLYTGVKEIDDGNLDHRISLMTQDEIGFISRNFNQMMDNLRVSNRTLRKSEQKFRELTDMLPDIVYETDPDLNVTYFNRAGFEITGFGRDALEKGFSLRDFIAKEECQRLILLLTGKEKEIYGEITSHHIKTKNGDTLFGENNAVVIYENDKPAGLRGIIRDATQKIQTENALIQAQKMETIGTLAGGIAHDFNNILTGITGTLSLLDFKIKKQGVPPTEELESDLETLQKSAVRAGGIVKQLLALSRRKKSALESVDLSTVAKDVYEICRNSFDKKIKLDFRYHDEGAYVMADETQMGQVLLNLCVNARDAMTIMRPEGSNLSGELSVSIEKLDADRILSPELPDRPAGAYCRIRVKDTGVGIDPEIIPLIFDPFYTTKLRQEGSGLGLSMVYNIVKVHDGFIDIDSDLSSGTTFDIYIPSDDSSETRGQADHESFEPGSLSAVILIVDDDPAIHKTCGRMLEALGCTVVKAMNGKEALEIYLEKGSEIDAVILDVVMPGMSGDEVFDKFKKINPEIRVLISSGFREDIRIDKMIKNGAAGFMQKPYTLQMLAKEISLIINRK